VLTHSSPTPPGLPLLYDRINTLDIDSAHSDDERFLHNPAEIEI